MAKTVHRQTTGALMATSPESLIFHAIKRALSAEPERGPALGERGELSDDAASQLTNSVLTALHRAGFRIVQGTPDARS